MLTAAVGQPFADGGPMQNISAGCPPAGRHHENTENDIRHLRNPPPNPMMSAGSMPTGKFDCFWSGYRNSTVRAAPCTSKAGACRSEPGWFTAGTEHLSCVRQSLHPPGPAHRPPGGPGSIRCGSVGQSVFSYPSELLGGSAQKPLRVFPVDRSGSQLKLSLA